MVKVDVMIERLRKDGAPTCLLLADYYKEYEVGE
jgi:hypothetical protein